MRLLILSDLHHELWRDEAPQPDLAVSKPDAVVLAGDINTGARGVDWATKTFPGLPVLYVHGNHEGYGENLEDMQKDLRSACEASGHVHFLDCDEIRLNGVRFLGATLWTNFRLFGDDTRPDAMEAAEKSMVDYRRIRLAQKGYRKLKARDTAQLHAQHKSWLRQRLAEPFVGKTVVITHMAPSMKSVAERYAKDLVSAAYASQLEDLVSQADLWIHGHTHDSFDYFLGKCRVLANPCGYKTRAGAIENARFDINHTVEI